MLVYRNFSTLIPIVKFMDQPIPAPLPPSPIPPGTPTSDVIRYLIGSSNLGSSIKSILVAIVVAWFGSDKTRSFWNNTSLTAVTDSHVALATNVLDRLDRMETLMARPRTQGGMGVDLTDPRNSRPGPFYPPLPSTNRLLRKVP